MVDEVEVVDDEVGNILLKFYKQKMKKIWLFILWLCSIFLAWNFTQAKDYEYTNLDITANILVDGTIDVKEDFTADFFVSKHGIIRDIPLNYSVWWKDFHIEISDINVKWKTYSTSQSNWNIEIKIWDADRTVIWKQNYPISYRTYWLIKNFSWMWYAELYWNLVWYDFDTNINKVKAELILPKAYTWFTKDDFLITTDWKSKTIDWFNWTVDWSKWNKIIITYDKKLSAKHGITLAIKFPNNYFEFNHDRQAGLVWHVWTTRTNTNSSNTSSFKIKDSRALVIAIGGLCVLWFVLYLIWKIFRRLGSLVTKAYISIIELKYKSGWYLHWSFARKYPVIVQYEPPKWLDSAEVWLLLHRRSDWISLSSLIYKWIWEWLISVSIQNGKSKTYTIKKIKDISSAAKNYENSFRFSIFGEKDTVKISEDKKLKIEPCLNVLERYWCKKWWLKEKKTKKIISSNAIIYIIIFFLVALLFIIPSMFKLIIGLWIFTYCFPGLLLLMDIKIPKFKKLKLTESGAELVSKILWYREFLKSCDENKLKTFLEQDPLYFDKILPYAVVFGIETELIEKVHKVMDELWLTSQMNYIELGDLGDTLLTLARYSTPLESSKEFSNFYDSISSYSSDSWFSSGSSFSWWWGWFSSWWGGGWWGGRSW